MEKNVYGYLLITKNSMDKINTIASDYFLSTSEMEKENKENKTNYCCLVVSIDLSWWQRKKLSHKTGIPMKKICNVKKLTTQDPPECSGFNIVIWADSFADDTFCGRVKVFDTEENIPREDINPCIEVIYEL